MPGNDEARPMTDAERALFLRADDYVASLRDRADAVGRGAPLWHGWAIREAWLAGHAAALATPPAGA